jgi:hypothetical protein
MRARFLVGFSWLSATLLPQEAALRVEPDPKNHVAASLAGSWQRDGDLTKRLGKTKAPMALTIREDHRVLEALPAAVVEHLRGKRIYTAGTMQVKDNEQTFVLTAAAGNPEIFVFRSASSDPVRGSETLRVMLVRGETPAADLLFVADASLKQPFAAFARAPEVVGALEPAAALTEMVRLLEADKYGEFLKTWCDPEDFARMAPEGSSIDALGERFRVSAKGKELFESLVAGAKLTPKVSGDDAIFEGEGLPRPLRLKRVAGRWYLCNR